jgi:hypothetical protein
MKKQILATASAVALTVGLSGGGQAADITAPIYEGPALITTSAVVGLWLSGHLPSHYYNNDDGGLDDNFQDNAFGFGAEARGIHEFSPGHALQLEALALGHTGTKTAYPEEKSGALHIAAGAHWVNRTDWGAWGIFGGATHNKHVEEEATSMAAFLGGEVARHMNNRTYYAQAGGLLNFYESGEFAEPWSQGLFARVGARHFFNEYTKLEGSLAGGFGKTNNEGDSEKDGLYWVQLAAEWEHQMMGGPFSFFIGYQGDFLALTDDEDDFEQRIFMHTAKVGVRMVVGAPTIYAQNMSGANTFTFVNLSAPSMYADELDW